MEALINIIKENGNDKEKAIEEVSSNIEDACHKDELYELSVESLTDVLRHTSQLNYKTAHTIIAKAATKYKKTSVNILSSLHVDEGMSEQELETLLSLIPGIHIFSLLGSFTKKIEIDYDEVLRNAEITRKNLEEEINANKRKLELYETEINEIKLQKELEKLKEIDGSRTEIERKLNEFNEKNERNINNTRFRNKLKQEINDKPKELEEIIIKAKSLVGELQRIINESSKIIKTYEKSQKPFTKLFKKFTEIDAKYQTLYRERRKINAILIGDNCCGKTCLLDVLDHKEYRENPLPTLGISETVTISPENRVIINIYDTPGQVRLASLITPHLKRCQIFLLCFSNDYPESFKYLFDYKEMMELLDQKEVIFVKTKIDREKSLEYCKNERIDFIREKGYKYFEVSAKTGKGIKELRDYIFEISEKIVLGI